MTTEVQGLDLGQLTGEYVIDAGHSRVGFVARHAMVTKVRGQFTEFEGKLVIDGDNPANSSGEIVIQAKSIDTRNADRDNHIRSNDFLAMDEFPTISFKTTKIEGGPEEWKVTGDLTVRGVTKPVTFDVTYLGAGQDPWGNTRVGFEGSTVINRKDWGVSWNLAIEAGGVLVSEKVTLEFEFAAVKQ
ncbi:MAG: YceI family protein [Acidimicrobiales bacterium]|jgi:polyisoprenoid-binding protein YceI|nr:YceI family protein [Acidimicrobiales bacterium]HLV90070.1 YceI family protein [Acidimicrobiia bacterium]